MPTHKNSDQNLIDKIERSIASGKYFDAPLETDERVLARITDGIYRQPWSALREMIANSYDADATTVSISTDAPRFGTIKVSDDGIGMGPEALANLVRHIGGSAKRTQRGPKIGVTSKDDPTRSGGRTPTIAAGSREQSRRSSTKVVSLGRSKGKGANLRNSMSASAGRQNTSSGDGARPERGAVQQNAVPALKKREGSSGRSVDAVRQKREALTRNRSGE
jgi:hypothetical protein